MSKYTEQLQAVLEKIVRFCTRYSFVLFLLIFAILAGFLVIRIGEFSRSEPTQAEIDERLKDIKPSKLDEEALSSLKQLRERNISIEALFDNGRTNPFED